MFSLSLFCIPFSSVDCTPALKHSPVSSFDFPLCKSSPSIANFQLFFITTLLYGVVLLCCLCFVISFLFSPQWLSVLIITETAPLLMSPDISILPSLKGCFALLTLITTSLNVFSSIHGSLLNFLLCYYPVLLYIFCIILKSWEFCLLPGPSFISVFFFRYLTSFHRYKYHLYPEMIFTYIYLT